MKRYAIVEIATGEVKQTYRWGDGREFPSDIHIEEGYEVVETEDEDVDCDYHTDLHGNFFILDITDKELEVAKLKLALCDYEDVLSNFQEATWQGLGVVETNLPQEWQDKLNHKRSLRKQLADLEGTNE